MVQKRVTIEVGTRVASLSRDTWAGGKAKGGGDKVYSGGRWNGMVVVVQRVRIINSLSKRSSSSILGKLVTLGEDVGHIPVIVFVSFIVSRVAGSLAKSSEVTLQALDLIELSLSAITTPSIPFHSWTSYNPFPTSKTCSGTGSECRQIDG